MKMRQCRYIVLFALVISFVAGSAYGQVLRDSQRNEIGENKRGDKKKEDARSKAKRGLHTWVIDEMSGLADSVMPDTMTHMFQNRSFTEGTKPFYGTLGNLGSPRFAKLFTLRPEMRDYIFSQPYDFVIKDISSFRFTNTLSPITNITYHECGNSDNGEDHLLAKYAVNINKDAGVGFDIDYIYGRGFHDNQSTADFDFNLYGSVIKNRYKAHWLIFANHIKTRENGGIIDDEYVTDPEKFPTNYTPKEIPTNFNKVWNKMHIDGAQLVHRYSVGYNKVIKKHVSADTVVKKKVDTLKTVNKIPEGAISVSQIEKKPLAGTEEAKAGAEQPKDSTVFIPVSSIIHSLKVGLNSRKFIANQSLTDFYTFDYFGNDSVCDKINNVAISNYLALELSEGLNRYLSAGIRLFAKHEFNKFIMPGKTERESFIENRVSLGAQIFREQSKLLNYSIVAQTTSDGTSWGEYKLKGQGTLTTPLWGDSVKVSMWASSVNQRPTFFYRRYQSSYLWWDNDLSKQLTNNIGFSLVSNKLNMSLRADIYNITNYTCFGTVIDNANLGDNASTYNTVVSQSSKNMNVVAVALDKNFKFGILNWENSVVWQTTNDKQVLPLPKITAYSNLYLKFRIARVLNTELGADVRYFSKYYAPVYSAALGQYANQSPDDLVKVGNHPVINAYVNFHLKHTRFYVMASHINYSRDGGTTFHTPHYPVNPFTIHFGLSWNFFN